MKISKILIVIILLFCVSCGVEHATRLSIEIPKIQKINLKVVKQDQNQQELEIKSGESLNPSDYYAIYLTAHADAYVYVFRVDSNENIIKLFPNYNYPDKQVFLKSDQTLRIPNDGKWFDLKQNIDIEKIFVLAINEPIDDPDKRFEELIQGVTTLNKKKKSLEVSKVIIMEHIDIPKIEKVQGKRKGYPPSDEGYIIIQIIQVFP